MDRDRPSRRSVIGTAVSAAVAAGCRKGPAPGWHAVGKPDDFRIGATVRAGHAWVRRTGEREFVAFSSECTHQGCQVRWRENAGLFTCPCHGGAFYADGQVACGPPDRSLVRYPVRVQRDAVEIYA